MNLPNKLTVLRIVMTPLFLLLLMWNFPFHHLAACAVFGIASLTDYIDGNLARKHNLITNLGKFLDPLADKMLTTAAFLGFLAVGKLDIWAVMLILSREFLVTSVRLMAAKDGTVVAASLSGKLKTVMQMVSIIFMLAALEWESWQFTVLQGVALPAAAFTVPLIVGRVLVWIAVVLTIVSGVQYYWQFRHLMTEK